MLSCLTSHLQTESEKDLAEFSAGPKKINKTTFAKTIRRFLFFSQEYFVIILFENDFRSSISDDRFGCYISSVG